LFHSSFIRKGKNHTIPNCHQYHSRILEKYVLICKHCSAYCFKLYSREKKSISKTGASLISQH